MAEKENEELMIDQEIPSFPLRWPAGWERTPDHKRKASTRFNTTFDRARRDLNAELGRLGAKSVVISSWLPLRRDGQPYSDQARRRLEDPGVAVYFMLRGKQMVMARDAYTNVHDNLRSIGLGIAHLRGLERHGGGMMMERAFGGFEALANPETFDAWAILGLRKEGATIADVQAAFRRRATTAHPDSGGSTEKFQELEGAKRVAIIQLGGAP